MQFIKFHEIIQKRASIDDEWHSEVEKCWKEMIYLFSLDIDKTISFLHSCSSNEFCWMSEIFEDIAQKTQSKKFIQTLKEIANKYQKETAEYNLIDFINSAECLIIQE